MRPTDRRPRRRASLRAGAALAVLALAGGACTADQEVQQRQAEFADEGIQLTGRVNGAQLSVSYGDPDFFVADCDLDDGYDVDWCLRARSIDGAEVRLVLENPSVAVAGADLDVVADRCEADFCDGVEGGAVVDLRVMDTAKRAIGGYWRVESAGPDRYVVEFNLRFDDGGQVTGRFNVRPLGALVPADDGSEDGAGEPGSEFGG